MGPRDLAQTDFSCSAGGSGSSQVREVDARDGQDDDRDGDELVDATDITQAPAPIGCPDVTFPGIEVHVVERLQVVIVVSGDLGPTALISWCTIACDRGVV